MAASRLAVSVLLVLLPAITFALDCRKFSFAPACRGIMLKRSLAPDTQELPDTGAAEAQRPDVRMAVVRLLLAEMDQEGLSENACVTPTWIMRKLFKQGAAAGVQQQQ